MTLKALLEKQRTYLDHFFKHIDFKAAEQMLQLLNECKGVMIFSGIGKSGLVAKKIAVTMTSTGTKALYLSPANALHGDIGIVTNKDVFIIVSKSGESDELLQMLPFLRNKDVKLIAMVSNAESRLAKACDFVMLLPVEKELCPFDLAPTTSTTIQMIFGDVLAIALMELKKFSIDQYALNHPSGRIGKRATVKVKDLMITGDALPLCKPKDKLVDILVELSNKRCGCVLVINDLHVLQGIFTDGDLRRSLQKKGGDILNTSMEHLMTRSPRSIGPEDMAWKAMQIMESGKKSEITVLPVLDEHHKILGIIKLHDIVQAGV